MIFLRGSPCGRTGARKSLEEKRREASAQGWVGDQQTVVALKWSGAKPGERRVTQGRRLSTIIVGSLPGRATEGREARRVGQRVCNSGALSWCGGRSEVSWRERSEGASRRPQYGRDLRGAGLRASALESARGARRHGSGGAGPGAVDAVYHAPVGGPKGK
jgi:hypothetical protein